MAVNSPQPNLLCVIKLCVCLSSLYDQDSPFFDFVVLFIVVVVANIVVRNHLLGMDWSVVTPLGTITYLPERWVGVGGVSFVRLSSLICCHLRHVHSCGELPIWKGLVCRNPSGHHYLPPNGRSWFGSSVIWRVYFVQLYPLFHRRRRHAHSCGESPFGEWWVCHNPSGHYHLSPSGRSGRGLSCLSMTLLSFLLLSLSHS